MTANTIPSTTLSMILNEIAIKVALVVAIKLATEKSTSTARIPTKRETIVITTTTKNSRWNIDAYNNNDNKHNSENNSDNGKFACK